MKRRVFEVERPNHPRVPLSQAARPRRRGALLCHCERSEESGAFPPHAKPRSVASFGMTTGVRRRVACRIESAAKMKTMYSAQVLDHFQHPRNAGEIADADAWAEIENPVCGDVLRLTLKMNGGRIADMRFKAKGCVASIACASAMTELARGKDIREAQFLRRDSLIDALGGLPQASAHAAQLALDALSAALRSLPAPTQNTPFQGSPSE
jgi:nitrogen fixation protein NifU and related proteins